MAINLLYILKPLTLLSICWQCKGFQFLNDRPDKHNFIPTMKFSFKLKLLAILLLLFYLGADKAAAQQKHKAEVAPVYVDKQGVMRWKKDNKEANFFGVNYTVPIAYGFLNIYMQRGV